MLGAQKQIVPQMYFASQVITSMAKDDVGGEKKDESQIVTLLWGKRNDLKYFLQRLIGLQQSVNNNLKNVGDKKWTYCSQSFILS